MLDWKFPQVCYEYFDVLCGMCYAITQDEEEAQREALNCILEVAKHIKPRHSYEDVTKIALFSGTNFLFRRWHDDHLDQFSPPVIKVDKKDFLY